jgi:hypothetical protein
MHVTDINFLLKVDCGAIFSSDEIDRPSAVPPVKWEEVNEYLQVFLFKIRKKSMSFLLIAKLQVKENLKRLLWSFIR